MKEQCKWDIRSTLICLAIFLFLVYYYSYQPHSPIPLSSREVDENAKSEGRRTKRSFVKLDKRGSPSNKNNNQSLMSATVTPMTPPEEVDTVNSSASTEMPTKQIFRQLNRTGIPRNNNNNHNDNNQSVMPTTVTPMTSPEDVTIVASDEIPMKQIFATHKLKYSLDNIFFIETSCANDRRKLFRPALDLPNVSVAQVNLTEMYENSPLSAFLNGRLRQSAFPVEHNADILRILLVYLFGGTYMDLDIVSTRPLSDLGINYIGAEMEDSVGTGVFNFEARHPYLKAYLLESYQAYSPQEWTSIGPALATSVLRKFCNLTESTNLATIGKIPQCGITVWSNKVFYPIRHWDWTLYWNNDAWPQVKLLLNETYAVHVWNHKSAGTPITVGSQQPYAKLAERNCAPVYSRSGNVF